MNSFSVGHVTVKVIDGTSDFAGEPERGSGEMIGSAQLFHINTSDGLDMTVGVITWPGREGADVQVIDFEDGPEPYTRLIRAGTMNMKTINGEWVARVTAMKINGKPWPTGNRVTWGEIDWLNKGSDTKAFLTSLGATHTGTYLEVYPGAAPAQRGDSGLKCPVGNVAVIAAIYALTRVEAITQQLGVNGPKALD